MFNTLELVESTAEQGPTSATTKKPVNRLRTRGRVVVTYRREVSLIEETRNVWRQGKKSLPPSKILHHCTRVIWCKKTHTNTCARVCVPSGRPWTSSKTFIIYFPSRWMQGLGVRFTPMLVWQPRVVPFFFLLLFVRPRILSAFLRVIALQGSPC